MSPDRLSAENRRAKFLVPIIYGMAALTLFLTGFVVYALIVGDPQEDKTATNVELLLERQAEQDKKDEKRTTDARNANACTAYQNHRAIEEALRDIAELNQIKAGDPRVLPSQETIDACKAVEIEIDGKGIPQVSNIAETDIGNEGAG